MQPSGDLVFHPCGDFDFQYCGDPGFRPSGYLVFYAPVIFSLPPGFNIRPFNFFPFLKIGAYAISS